MSNLAVARVIPFIGAKAFEISRDFYVALGWKLNWDRGELAELELGGCRFFLQRFYQKQWCENSMLRIAVADAEAWHAHASDVIARGAFAAARAQPPKREGYGTIVAYVWDPSGVLLHFAQPIGG